MACGRVIAGLRLRVPGWRSLGLGLLGGAVLVPGWAAEIYHCTEVGGRQVFSQRPCSVSARKLEITGQTAIGTVAPDTDALESLAASNQLRDIERNIQLKEQQIEALKQQRIDSAKGLWEQRLYQESRDTAQRYQGEIEGLYREIEALKRERTRALSLQ